MSDTNGPRDFTRSILEAAAKHMPPSVATIRVLDINGAASSILSEIQADLEPVIVPEDTATWQVEENSIDAVIAYNVAVNHEFLKAVLHTLRPGGRLIAVSSEGEPDEQQVVLLDGAGYTRILVEPVREEFPSGVLVRGEKPHDVGATPLERIRRVADQGERLNNLNTYKGRYLYLLIRQIPNKPAWALHPDEPIEWHAAALAETNGAVGLAFSSLPKAVEFMQPAVLSGQMADINKIGKFTRETVQSWPFKVLLNPPLQVLDGRQVLMMPISAELAEPSDEYDGE